MMISVQKIVAVEFVRFCIVGTAGFIINFALLSLFYKQLAFPIFISQALASEIALSYNFAMHHNWTYKTRQKHKTLINYIIEFHMTSWVAIIGSAVLVSFCVGVLGYNHFLALAVSSATALLWNFLWTKYFVWGSEKPAENSTKET